MIEMSGFGVNSLFLSIGLLTSTLSDATTISILRSYLGPDTLMPLASAVAAAVGVSLVFWQRFTIMIRTTYHRIFSRNHEEDEEDIFGNSSRCPDTDPGN